MATSVIKNSRKIFTSPGGDSSLPPRVTILENNEYKITYYEIISGASGSVTLPTGATINAGEFGLSGNAILSKIDGSNKPTFQSPLTAGGVVVTASLNVSSGAWVASGVYTDANVAIIYSIRIKAINYGNLTYNNIVGDPEEIGTEKIVNKSDSYTLSSSTTYSSTKALVDGLATKGVGTILGSLGTTGTGKQIAFNSGTANTITGSDFVTAYNVGATTAIILANTSTSQVQGLSMYEGANGGFMNRYGSAFTATYFTGTSFAKAQCLTLEAGNTLNMPVVKLGSVLMNGIGQTSTNVATRHDATGWRQGTMADIHTANTNLFQVGTNFIYNDVGLNSFMTIGGTTNTIPLFVTSRQAIVLGYNTDSDPNIVSARTTPDAIATNSHGFVEASVFKSTTNNLSNNAYTDNGYMTNPSGFSGVYGHHASFQSQFKFGAGTLGELFCIADAPTVNIGTLTNRYTVYVYDGVGTGTITNQYGLYVPTLAKGSTINEAIHVVSNDSYFGGKIKMVTTSGAANVEAPQVSWYHASTIKTSYITDKIINNTSELKFNVSLYNFTGYKEMLTLRGDDTNTSADYAIINSSKLGLYNVTPVARATTAGSASTFVANTSLIANDTATFDGYTIGQVVKALRNLGILT